MKYEEMFHRMTWNHPEGRYLNPILQGDFSDPDVIREGDTYYMVVSTMQLCPGITLLESKDLVHWSYIGGVIEHPEELEPQLNYDEMYGYNEGVYAPSLRSFTYQGKKRYIIHTTLFRSGFVVAYAEDIHGPWTVEYMKDRHGRELKLWGWDDTCPYWEYDEKGEPIRAYLVASKCNGAWYPHVFQLSLDGTQLLDGDQRYMARPGDQRSQNGVLHTDREGAVIRPVWTAEASKILKFDTEETFIGPDGSVEQVKDYIYYFQSECFRMDGVTMRVPMLMRAKSPYGDHRAEDGAYLRPGTPEDPGTYETCHIFDDYTAFHTEELEPNQGGIIDVPAALSVNGTRDWYFVTHHGMQDHLPWCRPISLVKLQWKDGWLTAGPMQWEGENPIGKDVILPEDVYRQDDDFTGTDLSPKWLYNFSPRREKIHMTGNGVRLEAFPCLEQRRDVFCIPNMLSQRYLYSHEVKMSVMMDLTGMAEGQEAGIAVYNGGRDGITFGLRMISGVLRVIENGEVKELYQGPLDQVKLSWDIDENSRAFGVIVNQTTEHLFQMKPGGYRGCYLGLHTYNNEAEAGSVVFRQFRIEKK